VIAQPSCNRGICRFLFNRGKLPAVSCSCVLACTSERKETANLNQHSVKNAAVAPTSAYASSLKQPHIASMFGTLRARRSLCLQSKVVLNARNGLKRMQVRTTSVDLSNCKLMHGVNHSLITPPEPS